MSRVTIKWNDRPILRKARAAANKGIGAVAIAIESEAARSLGTRSGGRPSAPGQPPNTQTGRLRASINATKAMNLRAFVGSNLSYAKFLELGTSKMEARPFLRPAARKVQRKAQGIFVRSARKALKQSLGVSE